MGGRGFSMSLAFLFSKGLLQRLHRCILDMFEGVLLIPSSRNESVQILHGTPTILDLWEVMAIASHRVMFS